MSESSSTVIIVLTNTLMFKMLIGFLTILEEKISYQNGLHKRGNLADSGVAENNAHADKLMSQIRQYAALHGGIVKFGCCPAYMIEFNTVGSHAVLHPVEVRFSRYLGTAGIGFASKKACSECISAYKDELEWYFTKYQPMLYDCDKGDE